MFISSANAHDYDRSALKKDLVFKNRRAKYPLGINFTILGPSGLLGASADFFITPKVNFELGLGLNNDKAVNPNYFAGLKYHILGNSISNTTLYFGGYIKNNFENPTGGLIQELYLPIGLQRIKKNKFAWNIELAYKYNVEEAKSIVWGALKLSYRFKLRNSKLNLN